LLELEPELELLDPAPVVDAGLEAVVNAAAVELSDTRH